MAERIEADDEVRRFSSVWLGPPGYDLPFHIRYTAYGLGFLIFVVILLVEAVTPLPVGVPPVWELTVAILLTYATMLAVDHDKPLSAVVANVVTLARARPDRTPATITLRPTLPLVVKITKDPL